MQSRIYHILFIVFVTGMIKAQLPETDLWHFKIKSKDGLLQLTEGKNITSRKGYDNQPVFTPDDKSILYVSIREDNQSDVYSYSVSKGESVQLTKTKVSEYSPQFTPDNKFITCVVVESDSAQRIWQYYPDGSFIKCMTESIDSIGYYSWLSVDTLLYYKLTEPHSLRMNLMATGGDVWICNAPSRAIKKSGGNEFMYAIKDSSSIQYRIYNTVTQKSLVYASHKSLSEDFVFNSEWGLVKSEGSQLLRYDLTSKAWLTLFDFSSYGIKKITRFSFDSKNKQLVIVDNN
ncbi:MAG: PD40 domain-containing protein [Bacteroidia bacterium]|nr:PD40 domain-containing protein [Bacteroidia bacterium]